MKHKVLLALACGMISATVWGNANQIKPQAKRVVKKTTYKITTQDLSVPLGGRWNMQNAKFKATDLITGLYVNNKQKGLKGLKVSGKYNVNKPGVYTLTYRYGSAKKTAKLTVSKANSVYLSRGKLVDDGQKLTSYKSYAHFYSRNFSRHTLKTSGASKGTWNLHGAFGPSFYTSSDASGIQSVAKVGKYWYFVAELPNRSGKSRIIRLDDTIFKKLKKKSDLRWFLSWSKNRNKKWSQYKKYARYVKFGPVLDIGHGQSMTYHKGAFYLTNQAKKASRQNINIIRINKNSLMVDKTWGIKLSNDGIVKNLSGFNMTFGSGNTFYLGVVIGNGPSTPKGGYQIYTGNLANNGTISFKASGTTLKGVLGRFLQDLSYNPQNKRLYIVTDGAYMSLPTDKLAANKLAKRDFNVTYISGGMTHPLEAESLQFEGSKAYYVTASFPLIHQGNWRQVAK